MTGVHGEGRTKVDFAEIKHSNGQHFLFDA